MRRSFRSEWIKLRRRAMLLGGAGSIIGFVVFFTVVTILTSSDGEIEGPGITLTALVRDDGLAEALGQTATFLGVVALGIFAIAVASEYSQGTLRNLLVRQPDRRRLLAGKVLALASFAAASVVLAVIVAVAVAPLAALVADVDSDAWYSGSGLLALLAAAGNLALAAIGWGLLGTLLAIVLRSPAAAIGVGAAYALPFELILTSVWSGAADWLPGQLLSTLASGGTATTPYLQALVVGLWYVGIAGTVATGLFARRDVAA